MSKICKYMIHGKRNSYANQTTVKCHFSNASKPQDTIFEASDWQRYKNILECCIRGDQGKQAFLFIASEDVNCYKFFGRQFGNTSQD